MNGQLFRWIRLRWDSFRFRAFDSKHYGGVLTIKSWTVGWEGEGGGGCKKKTREKRPDGFYGLGFIFSNHVADVIYRKPPDPCRRVFRGRKTFSFGAATDTDERRYHYARRMVENSFSTPFTHRHSRSRTTQNYYYYMCTSLVVVRSLDVCAVTRPRRLRCI